MDDASHEEGKDITYLVATKYGNSFPLPSYYQDEALHPIIKQKQIYDCVIFHISSPEMASQRGKEGVGSQV